MEADDGAHRETRERGELLNGFAALADEAGCSMAELSLAWVLAQGDHIHASPGTTSIEHLQQNFAALQLHLQPEQLTRADQLINPRTVSGPRYPDAVQAQIDTEELPS